MRMRTLAARVARVRRGARAWSRARVDRTAGSGVLARLGCRVRLGSWRRAGADRHRGRGRRCGRVDGRRGLPVPGARRWYRGDPGHRLRRTPAAVAPWWRHERLPAAMLAPPTTAGAPAMDAAAALAV